MYFQYSQAGRTVGNRCRYSDSCFTCPLPNCGLDDRHAARVNKLSGAWMFMPRQGTSRRLRGEEA